MRLVGVALKVMVQYLIPYFPGPKKQRQPKLHQFHLFPPPPGPNLLGLV